MEHRITSKIPKISALVCGSICALMLMQGAFSQNAWATQQDSTNSESVENSWRYQNGTPLPSSADSEGINATAITTPSPSTSSETDQTARPRLRRSLSDESASVSSAPSQRPSAANEATPIVDWNLVSGGVQTPTGVIVGNMVAMGVDISHHNGIMTADRWNELKNAGVKFVILRCGYGQTGVDQRWRLNATTLENLGIPYGVYLYSYAGFDPATSTSAARIMDTAEAVEDARAEAKHTLDLIKGYNVTLPVYFDLEEATLQDTSHKALLSAMAKEWCSVIAQAGYTPGVYANLWWWNNLLTDSSFSNYERWVAQYNFSGTTYNKRYTMWQATSTSYLESDSSKYYDLNFATIDLPGLALGSWQSDSYGWWYDNGDGTYPTSEWKNIKGTWYYFYSSGYMATGWNYIGGAWYCFDASSGAMRTGWLADGSIWYLLDNSGSMASNSWRLVGSTWYYFTSSGAMKTGWLERSSTWYYLSNSGAMVSNSWASVNESWYHFDGSGAMQTGWQAIDGSWYYLQDWGGMYVGWFKKSGVWYYLQASGAMQTGAAVIDGTQYEFNASGQLMA